MRTAFTKVLELLQKLDQIFSRSRINRFNVAATKVEKIAATC